jgi:hypothetical protein
MGFTKNTKEKYPLPGKESKKRAFPPYKYSKTT